MKNAIVKKLAKVTELAEAIDLGLWTNRCGKPATKRGAEAAKAAMIQKAERCRRVLRVRYGMDV